MSSAFLAGKESTQCFYFGVLSLLGRVELQSAFQHLIFDLLQREKKEGKKIFSSTELLASPKTWFNSTFLFFLRQARSTFVRCRIHFFLSLFFTFRFVSVLAKRKTKLDFSFQRERKKIWVHICFIKLSC